MTLEEKILEVLDAHHEAAEPRRVIARALVRLVEEHRIAGLRGADVVLVQELTLAARRVTDWAKDRDELVLAIGELRSVLRRFEP